MSSWVGVSPSLLEVLTNFHDEKKEAVFGFLDCETTGLHHGARLVEVSFVVPSLSLEYTSLVIPEGFVIPTSSTQIHHITTEEAEEKGKDLTSVLLTIKQMMEKIDAIVSHSISFDLKVIQLEAQRKGIDLKLPKPANQLCTMKMGNEAFGVKFKLHDLGERLGMFIDRKELHRAKFDAVLCKDIFSKLRALALPLVKNANQSDFIVKSLKELYILKEITDDLVKSSIAREVTDTKSSKRLNLPSTIRKDKWDALPEEMRRTLLEKNFYIVGEINLFRAPSVRCLFKPRNVKRDYRYSKGSFEVTPSEHQKVIKKHCEFFRKKIRNLDQAGKGRVFKDEHGVKCFSVSKKMKGSIERVFKRNDEAINDMDPDFFVKCKMELLKLSKKRKVVGDNKSSKSRKRERL